MAQFMFKCPQCGTDIEADESFRGQVAECPHCNRGIVIPRNVSAELKPKGKLRPVSRDKAQLAGGANVSVSGSNGGLRHIDSPKRSESVSRNRAPVLESVAGASQRNIDFIRDSFGREVKTIKGTANILLLREVILFVCIALTIAGAIGGIWYSYRKRNQAEQLAWQREQERKRQEEEERIRREAARRKAQEEERLARERERVEAEAARKKAEELAKAEQERRRKYNALAVDFKNVPIDYWKNAPADLRPGNVKHDMVYRCLLPDSVDGLAFYDVSVKPREPMSVKRLSAETDAQEIPSEEFGKLCTQNPYLMLVEGKVYFCPTMKWRKHHVPTDSEELNPSSEEFGALYGVLQDIGVRPQKFRYEVLLQSPNEAEPMSVGQVAWGDSLSRDAFRRLVRTKLEGEARYRAEEYERYKNAKASKGKTRGGNIENGTPTRAPLSRWFARTRYYDYGDYSRGNTVHVNLPGTTLYRSTKTRVYGPTQQQINKQIAWEKKQQAEEEARRKREAARAKRQAEADARFAEENAVKDEDIDKVLNMCSVTFRAVQ